MTVPNTPLPTPRADDSSLGRDILAASKYGIYRLRTRLGTRGLVIIGAAVIAAGLALNWGWLGGAAVADGSPLHRDVRARTLHDAERREVARKPGGGG